MSDMHDTDGTLGGAAEARTKPKRRLWRRLGFVLLACGLVLLTLVATVRRRIAKPFRAVELAYSRVDTLFSFVPTDRTRLDDVRLETYADVRGALVPELERFMHLIHESRTAETVEGLGIRNALRTGRELVAASARLAEAHVAALRRAELSRLEYCWIGRRAFAALRQSALAGDATAAALWERVENAFVAQAPDIPRYQEAPPSLVERLRLEDVEVSPEECELVLSFAARLFEPVDIMYEEITQPLHAPGKAQP